MEYKRSASRYKDPFAVDPLPKAFYHPSPEKRLSKNQKSTSIAAHYGSVEDRAPQGSDADQKLSPVDEMFLRGAHMYRSKDSGQHLDDDVNFDETWPSSERPSSISLPGLDDENTTAFDRYRSDMDHAASGKYDPQKEDMTSFERRRTPGSTSQGIAVTTTGKPVKSKIPVLSTKTRSKEPPGAEDDEGSVLKRYVDRFRNSAPMSREEREQASKSGSQDFWWLGDGKSQRKPVPGFQQTKPDRDNGQMSESSRLTRENMEKYDEWKRFAEKQKYKGPIPESPGDKRTIELQERAERLLEKSSSTVLSTEPAVSTEGLGSTMSDMSSIEEYSYKPKFANYLEPRVNPSQMVAPLLPGQRPPTEDDPLYQWRLRRRMELAQQATPTHAPKFDFLSKTEQQKNVDSKLEEFKQRLAGKVPSKAQVQFTPAPVQQQVSIQIPEQTDKVRYHDPPIASPSLHPPKPRNQPLREVDPHLHLMCDLLPCPHRGRYQGDDEKPGTRSEGNTKYRKKDDNLERHFDTQDKNKEKESENFKKIGRYKQYLEAEKPDIDQVNADKCHSKPNGKMQDNLESPRSQRKGADVDDESTKTSIGDIENMVRNIGVRDADSDLTEKQNFGSGKDKTKKSVETKPKSNAEENSNVSNSESDHSQGSCKQTRKQSEKDVKEKNKEEKPERERVLKPQHSSSPKNGKKIVNAAIGQVIKEHLFSTSTSTVLSSVESLPPSASTERLPWKQKPPSHDRHVKERDDDDVPCESDEEFPDDGLLQMLRKQRAIYEQQLMEIDNALNKIEGR